MSSMSTPLMFFCWRSASPPYAPRRCPSSPNSPPHWAGCGSCPSWISSGRIETEGGEVADVELDDLVPFILELLRPQQHRTADVVTVRGKLLQTLATVFTAVFSLHGLSGGTGAAAAAASPAILKFGLYGSVATSWDVVGLVEASAVRTSMTRHAKAKAYNGIQS